MFWFLIPLVVIIIWLLKTTGSIVSSPCASTTITKHNNSNKSNNTNKRKTKLRFKPTVTRLYVDEDAVINSNDYILGITTEPLSTKPKKLSEKN